MFKSKLQEYCLRRGCLLPEYEVTREGGLDHCPHFKGAVTVNGTSFTHPDFCKSIKEAHNLAAKFAFERVAGCSNSGMTVTTSIPASSSIQLPETQETTSTNSFKRDIRADGDDNVLNDKGHMYKNQVQVYAQKRNLELPVYTVERVGPHARFFKSKVTLDGKTYESEEFFRTVREAESAAAKVVLALIIPEGSQEDDPSIYKNLLQELLQNDLSSLPKYTTVQAGLPHMPVFVSTLEIQGETFRGQEGKTKKQAEMNVAKVAYTALRERKFKRDDRLNSVGSTTHVVINPQCSSANIPVVGTTYSSKNVRSDAQPMPPDKQIKCEDKGLEGGSSSLLTSIPEAPSSSGSIQNLIATSSVLDQKKKKRNKKIMVFPQSSSSIPDDMNLWIHDPRVRLLHSDDKWIAVTENSN